MNHSDTIDALQARLDDRDRQLAIVREWMAEYAHISGYMGASVRKLSSALLWADDEPEQPEQPPFSATAKWIETRAVDDRVDALEEAMFEAKSWALRVRALERELVKLGDRLLDAGQDINALTVALRGALDIHPEGL